MGHDFSQNSNFSVKLVVTSTVSYYDKMDDKSQNPTLKTLTNLPSTQTSPGISPHFLSDVPV